jgi:hypothetical protein
MDKAEYACQGQDDNSSVVDVGVVLVHRRALQLGRDTHLVKAAVGVDHGTCDRICEI